jgi:hypothetical protein
MHKAYYARVLTLFKIIRLFCSYKQLFISVNSDLYYNCNINIILLQFYLGMRRLFIGSDHAGLRLKEFVKQHIVKDYKDIEI